MEKRCLKAVVHGVVQGVFFRYNTRRAAQSLGVSGWVKNMPDGTVALEAYGEETALETLAEWLHHGPAHARVSRVDIAWSDDSPRFSGFEIVH